MDFPKNKEHLRQSILSDDTLVVTQKRKLLSQLEEKTEENWMPVWDEYRKEKEESITKNTQKEKWKTYKRLAKFSIIPACIGILAWWTMLSGGINIYAFPGMAWDTRKALLEIQDKAPQYYNLITENIDTIRFEYLESARTRGGYAKQEKDKKIEIVILTEHAKNIPLLASTIAHEACHGKQFHDGRIGYWEKAPFPENNQKIEHECLLVGLDVLELLNGEKQEYAYYKSIGTGDGGYGDTWKNEWDGKDTTNGMIDLLSPKYKEWYFNREKTQ